MYSTQMVIKYFYNKPHKNVDFINANNQNICVFKCLDGSISVCELGNGAIKNFDSKLYKDDMWIIKLNPFKN